ncbi:hypothetical protein EDC04DRAFT_2672090 [Pisolithus marmoratus]|nr:hypothetical protein EDC04DRAFT_2672090 [Pisolithus marmoratus]
MWVPDRSWFVSVFASVSLPATLEVSLALLPVPMPLDVGVSLSVAQFCKLSYTILAFVPRTRLTQSAALTTHAQHSSITTTR